jgi:hypothetical protein
LRAHLTECCLLGCGRLFTVDGIFRRSRRRRLLLIGDPLIVGVVLRLDRLLLARIADAGGDGAAGKSDGAYRITNDTLPLRKSARLQLAG